MGLLKNRSQIFTGMLFVEHEGGKKQMGRTFGRPIGKKRGPGHRRRACFFQEEGRRQGGCLMRDSATWLMSYLGGFGKFKVRVGSLMGQHWVLTQAISSLCRGGKLLFVKDFIKNKKQATRLLIVPFDLPLPSPLVFTLDLTHSSFFYLFVPINIRARTGPQHTTSASSKPHQAGGRFKLWIIILLMKEAPSNDFILRILETPYETRSQTQHKTLSGIIQSSIPHCSLDYAKKLSFFLEKFPSEQQPPKETLLIFRMDPETDRWESHHFHHQPSLASLIASSSMVLCLSSGALKKSEVMAGSIEQQIKILQSGEYFTQVPKRRLYSVIQQAEAVLLGYGEHLKQEGRNLQDVYLARNGEFSYVVRDSNEDKSIEIYSFREGHLFSLKPLVSEPASEEGKEELLEKSLQTSLSLTQPAYGVRCKSSRGVLYRFSREFFNSHLLRYCQTALAINTQRLNALLQARAQQVSETRKPNAKLLAQKIPRSLSQELQVLRDGKAGSGRKGSLPKEPEPILDISQKPHDYQTLKLAQPTRNKLYSKAELATISFDPQKNESDLLLWKKSKCLRLQQLSKSSRPAMSKAETMMQFMKSAIQFEKTRRKPSIL